MVEWPKGKGTERQEVCAVVIFPLEKPPQTGVPITHGNPKTPNEE